MNRQVPSERRHAFELKSERLGPLPLINHFLARLDLEARLEHFVPTFNPRVRLPYAKGLGVLLRSILVEREPIYRQAETVSTFAPEAFGLSDKELSYLSDDAVGRALDHLFDLEARRFGDRPGGNAGYRVRRFACRASQRLDHDLLLRTVRQG